MRRRHFRGAKMMRTLESAIITLMSSSSGRGGQKSRTRFRGQGHSLPPFFCEGRPSPKQAKRAKKKKKEQTQQPRGQGTNNKGLAGWRPFQPRKKSTKKKIRRRASLLRYSWTRKRRRQPTHNNKKKKKVSLLPTQQTRKKEELVNKRIVVVVAVVSCAKTF